MSIETEIRKEFKVSVLRNAEEIRRISPEWRELFNASNTTAFQDPHWLLPWIELLSPQTILLMEVRRGTQLIGVVPLLIYPRNAEQVLAFMGGGVSDYLDAVIAPESEQEALAEIFCAILQLREDWTVLDLTDLPPGSPLLRSTVCCDAFREHDACGVLRLPGSKDELLRLFSKRQRANLRNAASRLERAGGGQIEIATEQNLPEFLGDLFRLHTTRWSARGESGVLAEQRVRNLHLACAPKLLKAGILRLSRLRLGDRTLAVIYSLFWKQTAYCYLQGFDPEFASLSPGTYLMYSVICDAVDHGARDFDFLRGEEAYKQHWRPERQPTYRIQISRRDLAARMQRAQPLDAAVA